VIDTERAKHLGDGFALASGGVASLAQWSALAGQVTPILSALFVLLSIAWLLWRMIDRLRFGPGSPKDEG
jgi:hypothetical protein